MEQKENGNETADKDKKKKRRILLLILLFLLFSISAIAYAIYYSNSHVSGSSGKTMIVNGTALRGGSSSISEDDLLKELKRKQLMVTDKISSQVVFNGNRKGTSGSWVVENPSTNKVMVQCELLLNGKSIATSVPVGPGQHTETIMLSDDVKSGTYDVTAVVNYFSRDDRSYLGKAGYQIKMIVM